MYLFSIHELEERHGVDLGSTYKNRDSARTFVHYIAESQRQQFHASLTSYNFCSVLMDTSTDKGHVENELFVILHCKSEDSLLEVITHTRYFCVLELTKCDADGLVQCLGMAC